MADPPANSSKASSSQIRRALPWRYALPAATSCTVSLCLLSSYQLFHNYMSYPPNKLSRPGDVGRYPSSGSTYTAGGPGHARQSSSLSYRDDPRPQPGRAAGGGGHPQFSRSFSGPVNFDDPSPTTEKWRGPGGAGAATPNSRFSTVTGAPGGRSVFPFVLGTFVCGVLRCVVWAQDAD